MANEKRNNYTAAVDDANKKRLMEIQRIYGSSPSGIATLLLNAAANVGADNYHEFMKEIRRLESRLIEPE